MGAPVRHAHDHARRVRQSALCDAGGWLLRWLDVRATGIDSTALDHRLLAETLVAVVPDAAFGPPSGGFPLLTCGSSDQDVEESIVRLWESCAMLV